MSRKTINRRLAVLSSLQKPTRRTDSDSRRFGERAACNVTRRNRRSVGDHTLLSTRCFRRGARRGIWTPAIALASRLSFTLATPSMRPQVPECQPIRAILRANIRRLAAAKGFANRWPRTCTRMRSTDRQALPPRAQTEFRTGLVHQSGRSAQMTKMVNLLGLLVLVSSMLTACASEDASTTQTNARESQQSRDDSEPQRRAEVPYCVHEGYGNCFVGVATNRCCPGLWCCNYVCRSRNIACHLCGRGC
jgi:hypothetical protein